MTVKILIVAKDNIISFADCYQQCPGTGALLESCGNHQHNFHVPLVQTQLLLLLLFWSTILAAAWCNLVDVASCNDDIKIFDNCNCCHGGLRETSFIANHYFASLQWWGIAIGAINFIVSTLAPAWSSKVVAQLPIVARACCCLAQCTQKNALVARGSLLPWMTYPANHPGDKGLIVVPIPAAILCKGFVITFFGMRLVGVLTILTLSNVHAISSILAVPNLGVFALPVFTWHDIFVVASCDQQHENLIVAWKLVCSSLAFFFYCHCSLQYDIKKWLSHCWHSASCSAINIIAGALHFCNRQCGWSSLIIRLFVACLFLRSLVVNNCCRMTKKNCRCILCNGSPSHLIITGALVPLRSLWLLQHQLKRLDVVWRHLAFPCCNQPCCAIPWHKNMILVNASCNTSLLPSSLQLTVYFFWLLHGGPYHCHTLATVPCILAMVTFSLCSFPCDTMYACSFAMYTNFCHCLLPCNTM